MRGCEALQHRVERILKCCEHALVGNGPKYLLVEPTSGLVLSGQRRKAAACRRGLGQTSKHFAYERLGLFGRRAMTDHPACDYVREGEIAGNDRRCGRERVELALIVERDCGTQRIEEGLDG